MSSIIMIHPPGKMSDDYILTFIFFLNLFPRRIPELSWPERTLMQKGVRRGRRVEGGEVEMRGGGSRVKELLYIEARRQNLKVESKN